MATLVAKWTGTSEGRPGTGTVERDYERARKRMVFREIFELAEAGKPFAVYSRARLKRVK